LSPDKSEPDLKYRIHISFLAAGDDAQEELEHVAKEFVHAFPSRLGESRTYSFTFSKAPERSLGSVLNAFRTKYGKPSDRDVGILFSCVQDAASIQAVIKTHTERGDAHPAFPPPDSRLHPISRHRSVAINVPSLSMYEPYRTFLVVLEKATFANEAGGVFCSQTAESRKLSKAMIKDAFLGLTLTRWKRRSGARRTWMKW
jgi:hypothetical protein